MNKYFTHLRPMERRLAVGVLVVLIIVLNAWLIWPHFHDWGNLQTRRRNAQQKLKLYQAAAAQYPAYEREMTNFVGTGVFVPPEDQAINFIRTIQSQAAENGVGISSTSRQMTHTNEFFVEQVQNITVSATDEQLVNFLFNLGSSASMIRVRDLELQSDNTHTRLNANIRLVASYQKKPPAKPATPAAAPTDSKSLTKTAK